MFIPKALLGERPVDEHKMNQSFDQKTTVPPARFTAKQGQYLAFIWAYAQINGRAPAEADFQQYFKVTAPSDHQMLTTPAKRTAERREGNEGVSTGSTRWSMYN